MTVKRISWLLITRVIKKSLHVLFLLLLFFYLLELPICTNSLRCKSALFALRLQDLKWYWQKIWRGKKLQYNQTQGNQSSNEWWKINFFSSNGEGVRDTNCIHMPRAYLSHVISHKRSIEKNKLRNETFRHGHTNLTLPCSGRVTEKVTKKYTHLSLIHIWRCRRS